MSNKKISSFTADVSDTNLYGDAVHQRVVKISSAQVLRHRVTVFPGIPQVRFMPYTTACVRLSFAGKLMGFTLERIPEQFYDRYWTEYAVSVFEVSSFLVSRAGGSLHHPDESSHNERRVNFKLVDTLLLSEAEIFHEGTDEQARVGVGFYCTPFAHIPITSLEESK